MKNTLRIAALVAAFAALPAFAQERATPAASQPAKFGIGVGLTTSGTNTGELFFVPMNVTPKLRIEPFIGWSRSDIDVAAAGNFFEQPEKISDFTFGVGGFALLPVVQQVDMYVGGRLALEWQSQRNNANGNSWDRRNTILAPVFGAEYQPHPRVALGAELMLGIIWFGDTNFPDGTSGGSGSGSFTQGTLFARFFLF